MERIVDEALAGKSFSKLGLMAFACSMTSYVLSAPTSRRLDHKVH